MDDKKIQEFIERKVDWDSMVGKRFGRLTVLSYWSNSRWYKYFNCLCDCGKIKNIRAHHVLDGTIISCTCFHSEVSAKMAEKLALTHGHSRHNGKRSREYIIWTSMRSRCEYKNDTNYHRYGGRGISVCKRWRTFLNFYKDMGQRPSPKHSIDRIDNDRNYCKSNCRWATMSQQARNKRNTLRIKIGRRTRPLADWCDHFDIKYGPARERVKAGRPLFDGSPEYALLGGSE